MSRDRVSNAAAQEAHALEIGRVARFCEAHVPQSMREKVRLEYTIAANKITIVERRAPWSKEVGPEWSSTPIAELRFTPGTGRWSLYHRDSNDRWHAHKGIAASPSVEPLLKELEDDPTHIFWG